MIIESVQLRELSLPLVAPFTTSFGTQTRKQTYLLRIAGTVQTAAGAVPTVGWGECVALADPVYSSEYLAGARAVTERYLIPALRAVQESGTEITAETVAARLEHFVGHRMAKAAVEMAVLDAQLRAHGVSFAEYLGATRTAIPSGVSVGIQDSIEDLLRVVGGYLDEGYVRIKLKIRPGWDVEPVAAMRRAFGDDVPLQVDANAAYTLVDSRQLRRLDEFGLLLIEQPLAEDDLLQHATLATLMQTPMCLDESIESAKDAADAIALGAASVLNIKPGRVGGYLEARRIHDLARAHGVAVWCGGMLETGLGRAANAGLAALDGFTLPGDVSASGRFYAEDITEPIVLDAGTVAVPTSPGLGAVPIPEILDRHAGPVAELWARG
ncbi:o-succinylbenzoate synthase [Microbacterium sp. ASV81]|uniref:o-succinylbenzoate synthase n=1 Tax=Microbacterium capsulatum TaxID=3041921 RepID=A0ABU0XMF3_9MICO|nr:o-succinylbenzoate synthase [Microbacterium sp. ASV81]MDQ4215778.1 o-succinylbenzoate synthase [Microbacterium sp. ASV81]